MSKATPVEIPLVNVNDETVKLTAWMVADGEEVREGQKLAEIETSKALVELVAPVAGQVHLKARKGQELPVGFIVAYIGDDVREPAEVFPAVPANAGAAHENGSAAAPAGTRFSKKALELLQSKHISLETFAGSPMVREQDVLEYMSRAVRPATGEQLHFALKGISLAGVTFPAMFPRAGGQLKAEFLETLREKPESIADLPSEEKCKLYREHGAEIGDGAFLGKGTVIVSPQIQIGDRVRIGDNGSVVARERFAVGTLSSFREGLVVRGGTVVFGENTFAGSRIQVGGGGNADPWALLVVGDNVYLGDDLFINICRPVLVGKEAFLTQRAILVTHNIGHSLLEGYENAFAPIVLEDFAQVGMNSTLYAGARLGQGSIVASNSYLISVIPKGKLAMGVPAHVVRDAARPIERKKQLQIAKTMVRQFHELLGLKGAQLSELATDPFLNFAVNHAGRTFQIGFAEMQSDATDYKWLGTENVLWVFASSGASSEGNLAVMNLLNKTVHGCSGLFADSAREFLRKRGIRLAPGPWRYSKGLI